MRNALFRLALFNLWLFLPGTKCKNGHFLTAHPPILPPLAVSAYFEEPAAASPGACRRKKTELRQRLRDFAVARRLGRAHLLPLPTRSPSRPGPGGVESGPFPSPPPRDPTYSAFIFPASSSSIFRIFQTHNPLSVYPHASTNKGRGWSKWQVSLSNYIRCKASHHRTR